MGGYEAHYYGTDALIQKAQQELDTDLEVHYAAMAAADDSALVWFYTGKEYQAHTYCVMECNIVDKNEYTFVRMHNPLMRGQDVAVLQWKGGYCYFINNPECTTLRFTDEYGIHDVEIAGCPYVEYRSIKPAECYFLDAEGNEV